MIIGIDLFCFLNVPLAVKKKVPLECLAIGLVHSSWKMVKENCVIAT